MIKLSNEDFLKMTEQIRYLTAKVEELQAANDFLNEHIKKYNKTFTKSKGDDNAKV